MSAGKERGRNFLLGLAIGIPTGYLAGRFIIGERNNSWEADLKSKGFSVTLKEWTESREKRPSKGTNLLEYLDSQDDKR